MSFQPDLTLTDARTTIDRALALARSLKQGGSFVIVDVGGGVVSASRIGEGPTSSMWISRAKAYVAAVQRAPSARSATQWRDRPAVFASMQRLMRDDIFPGPGALPIRKNGRVVGALSTGGGIGPWTEVPDVDLSPLAGANVEDYIISQALGIPYQNQHPDVERLVGPRIEERTDDLPHSLDAARRVADRAIADAERRGYRVGVAVVDEAGQLMQMDRMDGAPPMAPDLAEAKALTALNFQRPSLDVGRTLSADRLAEIRQIAHFKILAGGGGVPIIVDGHVVGAVGVHGGGGGEQSDAVARAAAER
ncbi:MAG TPA: heme-binding protein [Chloroflexota bacterium]|nr:heme-binding protein [Chloroflexota bacterium]